MGGGGGLKAASQPRRTVTNGKDWERQAWCLAAADCSSARPLQAHVLLPVVTVSPEAGRCRDMGKAPVSASAPHSVPLPSLQVSSLPTGFLK